MKPKHLLYIPAALVLVGGSAFAYLYLKGPSMAPPENIQVDMSPARVERGRYLFNLADCDGCHSERDFSRFGGPVVVAHRGWGQEMPMKGLPGRVVVPNITPDRETGIGAWTDGEKIRAIREGISRDGRVLFPMMPYSGYRHMSDSDVQALVAYMNTLTPVRHELAKTQIDFPVSMFIKMAPKPAGHVKDRVFRSAEDRGEYLATVAGCADCHTPFERGRPVESMKNAGGRVFELAQFRAVSANITPDDETGIGKWDVARFKQRFRGYQDYAVHGSPQVGPEKFTVMPWLNLSQLPDEDLEALYAYLKTVPAQDHKVEKAKF